MFKTLIEEVELKAPASKAWSLYGTLELAKMLHGKTIKALDVVEGDGGTGTIIKVAFKHGSDIKYFKQKFTKVDNEKRVKETVIVEGGYPDAGFNFFKTKFEIKENKNSDTSILKVQLEYEVKEEFAANASLVTTEAYVAVAKLANEHFANSN
ncbi:Bet v I domain-containing protein [Artemisia annua]|uniref:Bet v I domain-containing protein n=1 Tax=Artemisia annua TaxID=35608 RepID=A0A2U1KR21_ARTAN|nr:Bet v I domain-containing protein [Artemisia annua]